MTSTSLDSFWLILSLSSTSLNSCLTNLNSQLGQPQGLAGDNLELKNVITLALVLVFAFGLPLIGMAASRSMGGDSWSHNVDTLAPRLGSVISSSSNRALCAGTESTNHASTTSLYASSAKAKWFSLGLKMAQTFLKPVLIRSKSHTVLSNQLRENAVDQALTPGFERVRTRSSGPAKGQPLQQVQQSNMNEVQPVVFTQQFVQPKAATTAATVVTVPPVNPSPSLPSFNLSGPGVPQDGQRTINDLMSLYDTNIPGNTISHTRNVGPAKDQPLQQIQQTNIQCQQGGFLQDHEGIIFLESNISSTLPMFTSGDQFDQPNVVNSPFNSPFNVVSSTETLPFMFGSPFNLPFSDDYSEDIPGLPPLPKTHIHSWY
nr:protein ETHYLENE INSENSITIVE 3-like [Ipomoea batatas]